MKLRYIMILSIIIKIIIGMSGVIFFLRISGKTQMAQLTPLDSVNAFVLGALIGGVIYNPDLSVWYMIFAAVVLAFMVAYAAMFGFDKLKEALSQIHK